LQHKYILHCLFNPISTLIICLLNRHFIKIKKSNQNTGTTSTFSHTKLVEYFTSKQYKILQFIVYQLFIYFPYIWTIIKTLDTQISIRKGYYKYKGMNKSENTLLIWVLSWASLLLALLYSPLGSPDLYHPKKYFTDYQGVNFNKITIANVPKDVTRNSDAENEIGITSTNITHKKNYNYSVNASSKSFLTNSGAMHVQNVSNKTIQHIANGGANSGGGGPQGNSGRNMTGNSGIASLSAPGLNTNPFTQNNEISPSIANDSTTTQASQYSQQKAGADTGAEPIPSGDGWTFLIILVSIYGVVITQKKQIFQQFTR
jgi:hypothetical protein